MKCEMCGAKYDDYKISFSGCIELRGAVLTIPKGDGDFKGATSNACRKCAIKRVDGAVVIGGTIRVDG